MFQLKFETDNAAFDDGNETVEIARILREIADRIENESVYAGSIYDINGNRVGRFGRLYGSK